MVYDLELRGGITGTMWMPQCEGAILLKIDLGREAGRMDTPTLRDLISSIVCEHGGDFQNSMLTADTEIIVTSRKPGRRVRSRAWPITAFPSIADYVNADVYSWDFDGDED